MTHPESGTLREAHDYSDRLRLGDRMFLKVYREIPDWIALGPSDVGCGAGGTREKNLEFMTTEDEGHARDW